MNKILRISILAVFMTVSGYAQNSLWRITSPEKVGDSPKTERTTMPLQYNLYTLDLAAIKNQLAQAPARNSVATSNTIVQFPDADGTLLHYRMFESSVMHPELAARYPDIHSYVGQSIEKPSSTLYLSVTIFGLHAMEF